MLPTEPKVGWVFRYSYLWHRQYLEGLEDGDKDRPNLVSIPLPRYIPGIDHRCVGIIEVLDVARDEDQVVDGRGRGE